ncbi:hypothetical protein ACLOJK_025333 [Asimina triloba]
MDDAHKQGTLVLLENLDPSYTSSEIQVVPLYPIQSIILGTLAKFDIVTHSWNVRASYLSLAMATHTAKFLAQPPWLHPTKRRVLGSSGGDCRLKNIEELGQGVVGQTQ